MSQETVSLREVASEDAPSISSFLHIHLNRQVSPVRWSALLHPPWGSLGPNHGYQLIDASGQVAGAYIAVYSAMLHSDHLVCNLAAFCVLPPYRAHSLKLMRALLRPKNYLFTDLSPSGNVPALNERLGFHYLDTATRLVLNQPYASPPFRVTESPDELRSILTGADAEIYRDHAAAPAARHLVVQRGTEYGYLIYRRDRRKHLPIFASPLYGGGDRGMLQAGWRSVSAHLFRRGFPATLAERRVLGFTPRGPGRELAHPRAKMYRGELAGTEVDYLYSELTLLEW